MNKKKIALFLTCIITATLVPFVAKGSEKVSVDNCYIATTVCPKGYMDYAKANISGFVSDYARSTGDVLDYSVLSVGTPFAFADAGADVYYFPVIHDGDITYLFRVYPDGASYSGAITSFMAEDIEELSRFTSENSPMYLNMKGSEIVATIGNAEYELFDYGVDVAVEDNGIALSNTINYEVIDAKDTMNLELTPVQSRASYSYISLDKCGIQGGDSWCVGHCLTTVIRTQKDVNVTHTQIAALALGVNSPSPNSFIPWSSVGTVSQQYGMSPWVLNSTVSDSFLKQELSNKRPVIAVMTSEAYDHAVVVRGFGSAGTWSIWNPYYSVYEDYSMTGTYVPTGHSAGAYSFTAIKHAYNFK